MAIESSQRKDNLTLAIGSILLSIFSLSFGDAMIKLLSAEFQLWQLYVIRSSLAIPVLVMLVKWGKKGSPLVPLSVRWVALRSLLLASMWIAYYAALPHIQLSVAAAIYYTIPLFITLYSALFSGDRVSRNAWIAIFIGFIGVLIIARPSSSAFNGYVLLPLLAANLYAVAMILTRLKCANEDPKVLSFSLNISFIAIGLAVSFALWIWNPAEDIKSTNKFLLGNWSAMDLNAWMTMALLAAIIIIGSLFAAIAYQRGPSSTIATFDYSYLAFSAFWGWLVFTEIPDLPAIIGMLMIATAGIIALRN